MNLVYTRSHIDHWFLYKYFIDGLYVFSQSCRSVNTLFWHNINVLSNGVFPFTITIKTFPLWNRSQQRIDTCNIPPHFAILNKGETWYNFLFNRKEQVCLIYFFFITSLNIFMCKFVISVVIHIYVYAFFFLQQLVSIHVYYCDA